MYVCTYVCIYVCMYIWNALVQDWLLYVMYACTYIHTYIHLCMNMCVYFERACPGLFLCVYAHIEVCWHTYIQAYMHTSLTRNFAGSYLDFVFQIWVVALCIQIDTVRWRPHACIHTQIHTCMHAWNNNNIPSLSCCILHTHRHRLASLIRTYINTYNILSLSYRICGQIFVFKYTHIFMYMYSRKRDTSSSRSVFCKIEQVSMVCCYIQTYMYTCIRRYMYMYIHTHMYTYISHIHTHTHTRIHTNTHTHTHMHMAHHLAIFCPFEHTHTYVYIHTYMYT
jgi:hypothetical protein